MQTKDFWESACFQSVVLVTTICSYKFNSGNFIHT